MWSLGTNEANSKQNRLLLDIVCLPERHNCPCTMGHACIVVDWKLFGESNPVMNLPQYSLATVEHRCFALFVEAVFRAFWTVYSLQMT